PGPRRLGGWLAPDRQQAAGALALVLASTGLALVGPWLIGRAVDAVLSARTRELAWVAAAFLAAEVVRFGAAFAQTYLMQWIGQQVMHDLRTTLYAHLQGLPVAFFDRHPVGRLVTRLTNDVGALGELFGSGLVVMAGDLFLVAGIASVLVVLDPWLAVVALGAVPVLVVAVAFFRGRMRVAFREVRARLARINAHIAENVNGVRVVQAFHHQAANERHFARIGEEHLAAARRTVTYHAVFHPLVKAISAASVGLLIALGGLDVLDGRIALGVLVSFIMYSHHFFQPIQELSEKYTILQAAMASAERVFKLLDERSELPEPSSPVPVPARLRGEIEFRAVGFAYQPGRSVLRGVSFRVAPGECLAVVGLTGAGKSTLIHLLSRLYDVQSGQVLVDGIDVRAYPQRELRARIGVILQDVFVFATTVRENVRLGDESVDDDRVRAALARTRADRFVDALPGGLDQPMDERGATLSTGQRQLLAFARALAHDPSILVLDEATSNIDLETERHIQEATAQVVRGRTSIVIAHRLSTVRHADRVLVMHHGEVREIGTHRELLAAGGLYERLCRLQERSASE
ncbi:MAG: ABC transporter ATP-binding protein, partial [Planctomycetes bacterium]|nr:ABC transporter ATP-binding protein [Planctomycetota bacterium]